MVYCRHCGKEIEASANYCPFCGATARPVCMPSPVVPCPAPRDRNVLIIVAVVVIVLFVLPTVLSAVMYVLVTGSVGSPPSPMATLNAEVTSGDVITYTVLGVTSATDLSNIWVNMRNGLGEGGMNAGYGFPEGSDSSIGGYGSIGLAYNDLDGDRRLSSGDTIVVSSISGPLPSGSYVLELRYVPTGYTIALLTVSMP